ncbi:MAG: T9SS type A sorting domain-containing protein [Bacteroidetes bacterium]|jgi:poly(beta-D-mannuronate) lyase|nr:T9SS type A sorting domain-containing protein [Bacteroidota bacterium]
MIRRSLTFLLFFWGAQTALADVYPVTSAAQIASVMATAKPGDTLSMAAGTWTNQAIVFQGTGDSLRPIVLRAADPGQVILTGSSSLRIGGSWLVVDGLRFERAVPTSGAVIEFRSSSMGEAHHCRLTNTSVVDCNPPSNSTDYKWVSLYGHHNRVDHCSLAGKTHSGTTLVVWLGPSPNYHQIDSNYFGPRPPLGVNGGETIRVGTSDWSMYDSYTVVENNYFYQCNGEVEIISNKSCENIYRGNTFVSCEGALTLRHGNRCTVEGNFFFGNNVTNSGGIRIIGEDHTVINNYLADLAGSSTKSALPMMNGAPNSPLNRYFQVQRALVAFNTIVNCKYSLLVGVGKDSEFTLPPLDCTIANNAVRSSYGPLITYIDTPINMTYAGNVFYGASLGISLPAGISMVDPKLVKDAEGLWRPAVDSPLLGAAVGSYAEVVLDMDGQPRPAAKDVGADQASEAPRTRRPITVEDVGPDWMRTSTAVEGDADPPSSVEVLENFPNPFNPATTIRFTLARSQGVRLQLYDVAGRFVRDVSDGHLPAGSHSVTWNALHESSGTYLLVLQTEEGIRTRKAVLLK